MHIRTHNTPDHEQTHNVNYARAHAGSPVLEDQLEGCEAGPASGRGSRGTELQHSSPPQDGSALLSAALGLDSAAATASRMLPPPTTGACLCVCVCGTCIGCWQGILVSMFVFVCVCKCVLASRALSHG